MKHMKLHENRGLALAFQRNRAMPPQKTSASLRLCVK
jgi:hypothetical protein